MKRILCMVMILSVVFAASMASAFVVQLKFDGVANPVNANGVWAGDYLLSIQGAGQFSGYCVDLGAYANYNYSSYDLVAITPDSALDAAAWVLKNYGGTGTPSSALGQMAVWELITNGASTYTPAADQAAVDAIVVLANANKGTFDSSGYYWAKSPVTPGDPNYQDYIIPRTNLGGDPVVPIPPSVYLLGSGLLGLVGLRRRFKK